MEGKILKSIKKKVTKDDEVFYEVNVQYILNSFEEADQLIEKLGIK